MQLVNGAQFLNITFFLVSFTGASTSRHQVSDEVFVRVKGAELHRSNAQRIITLS